MLVKFIFFVAVFYFTSALELMPCKKGGPLPVALEVTECDNFPCSLYRGETANCNVTIEVPHDTNSIKTTIMASVGPITTKYPLKDDEVCHFLTNSYCPLEMGEHIVYSLGVDILKVFPKVPFAMEVTLTSRDEIISCFRFTGQVKDR